MGLLSAVLTLPLAPVRGFARLAEQIEAEARRQFSDPATIREQLADLDRAHDEGLIADAERDERADALVARLLAGRAPGPAPERTDG